MPEREQFDHSYDQAKLEEQKPEVRQIDMFAQISEVFDIDKLRASEDRDRVIPDQCWAIKSPQQEPAPDEHLEDAYDLKSGGRVGFQ